MPSLEKILEHGLTFHKKNINEAWIVTLLSIMVLDAKLFFNAGIEIFYNCILQVKQEIENSNTSLSTVLLNYSILMILFVFSNKNR